jgi:hypothetical protein
MEIRIATRYSIRTKLRTGADEELAIFVVDGEERGPRRGRTAAGAGGEGEGTGLPKRVENKR